MEVGIKKKKYGNRKLEVGNRKSKDGSRKSGDPPRFSYLSNPIQSNPSVFSAAYLKFEVKFEV